MGACRRVVCNLESPEGPFHDPSAFRILPPMQEHHITVTRSARYFTSGSLGGETRQVWFVCHGYSQLAETFLGYCQALEDDSRFLIAPEGLSRFYVDGTRGLVGASWMTREDRDHEIDDAVSYLDATYQSCFERIERGRVSVHALGFSQGVAAACRWAVRGNAQLDHLVMWGERLPPEFATPESVERLRDLRLTVVNGLHDEYVSIRAMDEHATRLRKLGLFFEDIRFDGGHRLDKETLRGIVA
jgi:predicted esterase